MQYMHHTADSSQSPVFTVPAVFPMPGGRSSFSSVQQPPSRSYHLADGSYVEPESRIAGSSSSGSAAAMPCIASGPQAPRERDEKTSPQAKKKFKINSRSPSDRMDTLSLDAIHKQNEGESPPRPSLAARHGRLDKYRSYFADAKVNTVDDTTGYGSLLAFHADDARSQSLLGEDNVIITPSLETTRGDELEAAIHLAGIASSGANERPRGAVERIYVTTSTPAVPSPYAPRERRQLSNMPQKTGRALKGMGSASDQSSSYGTAPSLATDASTFAGSSHGGGIFGSPSNSVGPSPDDENADISPATSADVHLQQQQPDAVARYPPQTQELQSESQSQADTDGNSTSNGTGKYVSLASY